MEILCYSSKTMRKRAFPQNFHTWKLGEITLFFAVMAWIVSSRLLHTRVSYIKDKILFPYITLKPPYNFEVIIYSVWFMYGRPTFRDESVDGGWERAETTT